MIASTLMRRAADGRASGFVHGYVCALGSVGIITRAELDAWLEAKTPIPEDGRIPDSEIVDRVFFDRDPSSAKSEDAEPADTGLPLCECGEPTCGGQCGRKPN